MAVIPQKEIAMYSLHPDLHQTRLIIIIINRIMMKLLEQLGQKIPINTIKLIIIQ
jgi:hypothetical protein